MRRQVQFQALAHNGDQHVGSHGDPHLSLDRILGRPKEMLDAQMPLDPAKEEFDSPTTVVQRADGQGRQTRVIGQKHQRFAGL